VGILGLALTDDSLIAGQIPLQEEGSGDTPDGATLTNNLFGSTPTTEAPKARFFGFLLERIGMQPSGDNPGFVPSKFSIGKHPTDDLQNLVPGYTSSQGNISDYLSSVLPLQAIAVEPESDGSLAHGF